MALCRNDSGLEICEVSPGTTVQGQLANCRGIYLSTERRRGQLDCGRFRGDLNRLTNLPNLHRDIQELLSSYRQRDARSNLSAKTLRRNTDLIVPGQQVGGCVKSRAIGRNVTGNTGGQVCNRDLSVRDD